MRSQMLPSYFSPRLMIAEKSDSLASWAGAMETNQLRPSLCDYYGKSRHLDLSN